LQPSSGEGFNPHQRSLSIAENEVSQGDITSLPEASLPLLAQCVPEYKKVDMKLEFLGKILPGLFPALLFIP